MMWWLQTIRDLPRMEARQEIEAAIREAQNTPVGGMTAIRNKAVTTHASRRLRP